MGPTPPPTAHPRGLPPSGARAGYSSAVALWGGGGGLRECVHSIPDAFAVGVRLNRHGLRPDRASLLRSHAALCGYAITSETLLQRVPRSVRDLGQPVQ